MIQDEGLAVVRVLSTDFSDEVLSLVPAACKNLQFSASIQVHTHTRPWSTRVRRRTTDVHPPPHVVQHKGDVKATLEAVRKLEEEGGLDIVGVTVGCESVSCPWAWIRFELFD